MSGDKHNISPNRKHVLEWHEEADKVRKKQKRKTRFDMEQNADNKEFQKNPNSTFKKWERQWSDSSENMKLPNSRTFNG